MIVKGEMSILDNHLRVIGRTYEAHVNTLVSNVFEPAGFKLHRWTKLPYLCEGDMQKVCNLPRCFAILKRYT